MARREAMIAGKAPLRLIIGEQVMCDLGPRFGSRIFGMPVRVDLSASPDSIEVSDYIAPGRKRTWPKRKGWLS